MDGVKPSLLNEPLLKLLGARAANLLGRYLEIITVEELLRYYPRKYLDLGQLTNISQLPLGENVSFVGEVRSVRVRDMRVKRGKLMDVVVTDGNGTIDLTFFNQVRKQQSELRPGTRALFSGKVSIYQKRRQLAQPIYRLLDASDQSDRADFEQEIEEPYAVYPARGHASSDIIRRSVAVVLGQMVDEIPDPVPEDIRLRHRLIDLRRAFRQIHRPRDTGQWKQAKDRFRFEEAFVLQTALARRRAESRDLLATACPPVAGGLKDALDERLPFSLTEGQVQVGDEIAADLDKPYPMHRLLQGEVGSGKTLVALRAMLTVIDNGGQAALLAPTEVLAAQHHRSITAMLGDLAAAGMLGGDERGTQVTLLTGSQPAAVRRKAMLDAASGEAGIVVGTHALLQEKVQFADLGMVVVDEQHRFGVEQRDALRSKGRTVPHLLVMTATPIPRTVAMTVFGDLETSTLRELPAGRSPIVTHVVPLKDQRWMDRTWARLGEEARAGHQAYVVCPRIGDGGEDGMELDVDPRGPDGDTRPGDSAIEAIERAEAGRDPDAMARNYRPGIAVLDLVEQLRETSAMDGLVVEALHARMPPDIREDVMRRFGAGKIDVLVSTTVIEVGVDVPNATAMVVMDADRFGVSQLHQLRGRVGRGSAPGLCLLVTEVSEGLAAERLRAVAASTDGFELARVDLEQRREGDVLGKDQSGSHSSLRILRVLRDEKVISAARDEANGLIAQDPDLTQYPGLMNAIRIWLDTEQEAYLDRG
jgi:ATP-dependent DNA helicase RecG